jgi:hypothetical protein
MNPSDIYTKSHKRAEVAASKGYERRSFIRSRMSISNCVKVRRGSRPSIECGAPPMGRQSSHLLLRKVPPLPCTLHALLHESAAKMRLRMTCYSNARSSSFYLTSNARCYCNSYGAGEPRRRLHTPASHQSGEPLRHFIPPSTLPFPWRITRSWSADARLDLLVWGDGVSQICRVHV